MNVWSEWIIENRPKRTRGNNFYFPVAWVEFADGAKLSVQASRLHYCIPRYDNPGPDGWTHFEVWMLHYGMTEEDLEEMGVVDDDPTTVSAEVLDRVAARHGGIKGQTSRGQNVHHPS